MRNNIIVSFLMICTTSIILSGCLKDKDHDEGRVGINVDGSKKIVEISGPSQGLVNVDLISSNQDTTVSAARIRIASSSPAANDIQVTLALDAAVVAEYNLNNNSNYIVPASNLYTIPSLTVTIPKGEREAILELTTKPEALLGEEYALGIRIASVSDPSVLISNNFGKQVVSLTIRNKYDGVYRMTGYHNRPTLDFPYDQEMHMVTYNGSSVIFYWPLASSFGHPIGTGPGAVSWYGTAIQPVVVFDTQTDIVLDVFNNSSAAVITRFDGATGSNVSRFDPVTRNMIVHWNYSNNAARAFFDTLTYVGPR